MLLIAMIYDNQTFLEVWEFAFIFPLSISSNKVGIVLLSYSGSLYAFFNWLEARKRKVVSGVPKPSWQG